MIISFQKIISYTLKMLFLLILNTASLTIAFNGLVASRNVMPRERRCSRSSCSYAYSVLAGFNETSSQMRRIAKLYTVRKSKGKTGHAEICRRTCNCAE